MTTQTRQMKVLSVIMLLTFLTSCGQSQDKGTTTNKKITRNFQDDINSLLPTGEYIVDIMDEVTMSPRRQELQEKFMTAMKENQAWFLEQQKIVETTGKGISYDPRLGLTEAEWEEYKKFIDSMSDMQVVSSGTAKVTVTKTDETVSFKSDGKLSYLNETTIDLKNKEVKVFDYSLPLIDTICVANADNVFKSSWRGYKWQFSDPANTTMPTTQEELANFSMKLYGLTLGLFDKTGKTYIEISGSETSEGRQTIRYKIPIVFQ